MATAQPPEYGESEILNWREENGGRFPDQKYGGAVVYLDRMGGRLCVRCAESLSSAPMGAQGARIARHDESVRCMCGHLIN